jgi:dynein heavy chain
MNPKSITQGQLYGEADLNTQEWTDGVLAIAVRNAPGRTETADASGLSWTGLLMPSGLRT